MNTDAPKKHIQSSHQYLSDDNETLNIVEIAKVIWLNRKVIIKGIVLSAMIAVITVINLTNIYRAEAILAPQSGTSNNSLAGIASQLNGITALTGLSFGTGEATDVTVSLATLTSRNFIKQIIDKHELLPLIMATESWDPNTNQIHFDSDIYNVEKKLWVRNVSPPKRPKPSDAEAYETFLEIMSVNEDSQTGLITLSVDHHSAFFAKELSELIIFELNNYIRHRDIEVAEKSIIYLEQLLKETTVAALESVFYQLMEEQTKKVMLAKSKQDYALRIIDAPTIPDLDDEVWPNRPLLTIVITFIGSFGIILYVLFRKNKPSEK